MLSPGDVIRILMPASLLALALACDDASTEQTPHSALDAEVDDAARRDAASDMRIADARAERDLASVDALMEMPDADVLDGSPDQGAPPDLGPPADPYVAAGVFEYIPGPACETPQFIEEDLPGDFEAWVFERPGRLMFAGDIDANGRAELFVWTHNLLDEEDIPEMGYMGMTLYEREPDGEWASLGRARGIIPHAFADLDGDGRNEAIGAGQYLGSIREGEQGQTILGYGITFAVRNDDSGGGEWRYDDDVIETAYEHSPNRWRHDIPFVGHHNFLSVQVDDADSDGRPDVLLDKFNVLIEWDSGMFLQAFDPEDPVFGFGGSTGPSTIGDFDGDGRRELALPTLGPSIDTGGGVIEWHEHYRIVESRGDNDYVDTQRLAIGLPAGRGAAAGDVNGDGVDDLLVAAGPSGCTRYQLWSTSGDNHLRLLWEYDHAYPDMSTNLHPLKMGDVDGDGDQEAIINMGLVATVWDWRPDAASPSGGQMVQIFGERISRPRVNFGPIFAEDLDGDGTAEVLFVDTVGGAEAGGGPDDWLNPRGVLIRSLRRAE